jgi:hypothetical protein
MLLDSRQHVARNNTEKENLVLSKIILNFAPAYERKVGCKQEKHCDSPFFENSPKDSRRKRAFLLSLVAYAIYVSIPPGVRNVTFRIVP